MRVFIGIELSEPVKKALFEVQQQIVPDSQKGRFTDIDNFHLTLQFIGEANPQEIEQLKNVVAETASEMMGFETTLDALNKFQKKRGLILWVGPKVPGPFFHLYDQLHIIMKEQSFNIEKQLYTPHVTLGRNIVWKEGTEPSYIQPLDRPIPTEIDNLTLFESVRVNGRLIYRPFARYALNHQHKTVERKGE